MGIEKKSIELDDSRDNAVNFEDNSLLVTSDIPDKMAGDCPTIPPVFHSKDCVYTTSVVGSKRTKAKLRVSEKLVLSDSQAGSLIGESGFKIKKLERSLEVSISVGGFPGERDRPVEIRGNKDQVSIAVETIK